MQREPHRPTPSPTEREGPPPAAALTVSGKREYRRRQSFADQTSSWTAAPGPAVGPPFRHFAKVSQCRFYTPQLFTRSTPARRNPNDTNTFQTCPAWYTTPNWDSINRATRGHVHNWPS
jgi:hypothetical protein